VLDKLRKRNIFIRLLKSFCAFPSTVVLGRIVNLFRLTILKEKFDAIAKLKFPKILRDFEIFIS
ncbi:hypothetical protein QBC45DRAFT_319941, partial [Copromyces sp. CBS 386.78]